jgi:hypothetical protein
MSSMFEQYAQTSTPTSNCPYYYLCGHSTFLPKENRYRIRLPSAKASRKVTEGHDLFLFVAFLKVTLEGLSSVHTAPRAFSLISQKNPHLDERCICL